MSLAESIIAAELSSRKGEQDVFRRLQERNSEVATLKKEKAALVAQHQLELEHYKQTVAMKLEQLEEERQHQSVLKDSSISELREVVGQLTSDPGLVVDEIRRAYVCGVRSPEKLRPARLTEPTFRPPSQIPAVVPEAQLGQFEYEKLRKIVKGANAALPGDQHILQCIQDMSKKVLAALEDTDSPQTQEECIALVRHLLKYVLEAREKCAWGDYVRPSQQHVEGPDISAYSIIDLDRSLSKQELREMEQLTKVQDMMDDPMGLKKLMQELSNECSQRLNVFDAKVQEVDDVHMATFKSFQASVNQVMHSVRANKTSRLQDEFEAGIQAKEATLESLKVDLANVLTHVTRTLQDINELQVCKAELEESLVVDEKNCIGVNKEIEECMHQLEVYKYTLKKRKQAISAVGDMQQSVVGHIQELLLARGKDLFEGKTPMLMRQFEVLPNVYCQCAIFENL